MSPDTNLAERIAILETKQTNISEELKELKDSYKEDMSEIKSCLLAIQEQTSTWKNIFWGITLTLTAVFTLVQWLFHIIGFDIKTFITTGHS
jgi:hypothetical protein